MAIPLSYNVRNIVQRPVSTLTTAIGVGLTVAIFIGALALASGFQAALVQSGSKDNALVLRKGADSEISSGISRDQANILRALPDVAAGPDGKPLVSSDLVVVTNKPRLGQPGSSNVTVRGIDPSWGAGAATPAAAFPLRPQVRITAGRVFAPGTDEVIVGERIAKRFAHCALGDRIRFQQREFTVVGHFSAHGASFESEIWGDNSVLMPALQRDNVFQSVTLRMKDPEHLAALAQRIETDPRLGLQVRSEREFYASQSELLGNIIRVMGLFITIIMAVGAIFGAMNTMYAAVGARTREIATLLVLGFSPASVMTSFMIESVILSLFGGLVGCLIALPINGIVTSTTNFSSFSEVAFAFRVTPRALVEGLMFASVMGLAGGLLPALRAARQPLAKSLREG